jgi:hypothetical protein
MGFLQNIPHRSKKIWKRASYVAKSDSQIRMKCNSKINNENYDFDLITKKKKHAQIK